MLHSSFARLLEHTYRKKHRLALRSSRMGGRGCISVFDNTVLKYALLQTEEKREYSLSVPTGAARKWHPVSLSDDPKLAIRRHGANA